MDSLIIRARDVVIDQSNTVLINVKCRLSARWTWKGRCMAVICWVAANDERQGKGVNWNWSRITGSQHTVTMKFQCYLEST